MTGTNPKPPKSPGALELTLRLRWLLVGGWILMMPPVPLGTALPPLSAWSPLAKYDSAGDCDRNREAMRKSARVVVTRGAGASALDVATALGQLQAKCVQGPSAPAPATPAKAPAAPLKPAELPPRR